MLIERTRQENSPISVVPSTLRIVVTNPLTQADLDTARHEARAEALTEFQKILSDNQKYKHLEALFPNRG